MIKTVAVIVLWLCCPVLASAQIEETPGSWPSHRSIADVASFGAVAADVALDTAASWRAADRSFAFRCQATRLGLAIGVSEVLKRVIRETRPDGSDALSFPSEHSAIAAASSGFNLSISLPLVLGTGYGRLAANKHHPKDVLAGLGIGWAAARWGCR